MNSTQAVHVPSVPVEDLDGAVFACPSCAGDDMRVFHASAGFPVHSTLNMKTRDMAVNYPRGSIALGVCGQCGFISNVRFDPALIQYSTECEESQGCSPTFNAFKRKQAEELVERYGLYGRDIIEIGCGKGEFLSLLCELGGNRGVGFDPAYIDERNQSHARGRITFINDYYGEKYSHHHADFICCRMTLEHISATGDFMRMLRRSMGDRDTMVFFQVPDVTRILRHCCFEDIYYEHCSYFSGGSLAGLFGRCGFDVLGLEKAYDGQYLTLEARPSNGTPASGNVLEDDLEALKDLVATFADRLNPKIAQWRSTLRAFAGQGRRVVLWGSGSKAVAFAHSLGITDEIQYTVDINPYRQNTFLPGTGHLIVSPAFLKEVRPHVVIIMNEVYVDEIRRDLDGMGLDPEILTI